MPAPSSTTQRLEAFSDGVIAIAITLLVLEIQVPHATQGSLVDALLDLWPSYLAFVLSFAAGAILTMLADTMMPEAFEHGGKLVGLFTTLGFALAFGISSLE